MADYQHDDDVERLFVFDDYYGDDDGTNGASPQSTQALASIDPQHSSHTANIQPHQGPAHIPNVAVAASESGAFSMENGDAFSNWPSPLTEPRIEPLENLPVYPDFQDNENFNTSLYGESGTGQREDVSVKFDCWNILVCRVR